MNEPREYPAFPPPDPNTEYPIDDQPDDDDPAEEPVRVTFGVQMGMNSQKETEEYDRAEWDAMTPAERHAWARDYAETMLSNLVDSWIQYENPDDDPEEEALAETKRVPAAAELPDGTVVATTEAAIKAPRSAGDSFPWAVTNGGRYADKHIDEMIAEGATVWRADR